MSISSTNHHAAPSNLLEIEELVNSTDWQDANLHLLYAVIYACASVSLALLMVSNTSPSVKLFLFLVIVIYLVCIPICVQITSNTEKKLLVALTLRICNYVPKERGAYASLRSTLAETHSLSKSEVLAWLGIEKAAIALAA